LVRGFSGFGSAMAMMPVLAALYGPQTAVAVSLIAELGLSVPLLPAAIRLVDWRQIGILITAAALATPLGAYLLLTLDPAIIRPAMSAIILAAVAILAFGWRYTGRANAAATLGTGAFSGLLNGLAGMAGPPVIFYYLAGGAAAARMRASLIVYFALIDLVAVAALAVGGAVDGAVLGKSALLMAPLLAGVWLGAHLFGFASEAFYRAAALVVLAGVAIGSLLL